MPDIGSTNAMALDKMVHEQLCELGWFIARNIWQHEVLDHYFTVNQLVHEEHWNKTAHAIRQSVRYQCYMQLESLDRREFREQQVPPFDVSRVDLAKKWARHCMGSFPASVGAIPSLRMRNIVFGECTKCHLCGLPHPNWDHVWECGMQTSPPQDVLLRRFAWPRHPDDFKLRDSFLKALEQVHGR